MSIPAKEKLPSYGHQALESFFLVLFIFFFGVLHLVFFVTDKLISKKYPYHSCTCHDYYLGYLYAKGLS